MDKFKSLCTALVTVLLFTAATVTASAQSVDESMMYGENNINIPCIENEDSESDLAMNSQDCEDECAHTILYTFNNTTMTIDDVYEQNTVSALLDDVSYYSDEHSAVILKDGNEVLDGCLEEGMIVQIYHGRQLYGEYTIGKLLQPSDSVMTASSAESCIKPLDALDISQDLTCQFECEKDNTLCDWCVENGYTEFIRTYPHNGQDISWSGIDGTTIRAMMDGTVIEKVNTSSKNGYGSYVKIDHGNGLITLYAHMQYNSPNVCKNQKVSAGTALGKVGNTGMSEGPHLHITVLENGVAKDPVPYLETASTYNPPSNTYKVIDGPLTIRADSSTTSTSYGTIANGTSISISKIEIGNGTYVFGLISSGTNKGRWISIGTTTGDIYAANMSDKWYIFDGPLNVRATASTSAASYGLISNGSLFYLSDVVISGDYIMGKIASSPAPVLESGSTCTVANAKGHWIAINYSANNYCAPFIN